MSSIQALFVYREKRDWLKSCEYLERCTRLNLDFLLKPDIYLMQECKHRHCKHLVSLLTVLVQRINLYCLQMSAIEPL